MLVKTIKRKPSGSSSFLFRHGDDAKTDMIAASLRLKPQALGGAAEQVRLDPGAAATHARVGAVAINIPLHCGQIGVGAAWQGRVIPVAAPLPHIAVHIVKAPGVGGIRPSLHRSPAYEFPRSPVCIGSVIEV